MARPQPLSSVKGLSPEEAVWRPAPGGTTSRSSSSTPPTGSTSSGARSPGAGADRSRWREATSSHGTRPVPTALRADLRLLRDQHEQLRAAVASLTAKDLRRTRRAARPRLDDPRRRGPRHLPRWADQAAAEAGGRIARAACPRAPVWFRESPRGLRRGCDPPILAHQIRGRRGLVGCRAPWARGYFERRFGEDAA